MHYSSNISNETLLHVEGVCSGYGKKEVLKNITFNVLTGQVVAMIGPNGSGKSTVLKTVFGIVRVRRGVIEFKGESCVGTPPPGLIERGIVYVPQGNRVFADLTVQENLSVSLHKMKKSDFKSQIEEVVSFFPVVKKYIKKRAGNLSGGEKQQLALALGLMKKPNMLLLDEPSLGLAPNLMREFFEQLQFINTKLGVTMLVAEHKVSEVFRIASWVLGLRRGEIIEEGKPEGMDDTRLKNLFLG